MADTTSLTQDLRDMGLRQTDTVLLHTAMKRIGPVEGGAQAVLDTLAAYFRPGLLCFPALSWTTARMDQPLFDVRRTPSIVGLLPEMFRQRPGVVRSWNPTHSMSALGADAAAFTARDHESGTPCGPHSSWHQLMERDAAILMVGCDLTSCTFLHGVEEWCEVPGRIGPPVRFRLILPDGSERALDSAAHSDAPSENYWRVEAGLARAGLLRYARFGQARTLVLRARTLYAYTAGRLHDNPRLFDDDEPLSPDGTAG